MTESIHHLRLKEQAIQLLLSKGYEKGKIIVDRKYITVPYFGQERKFRVDVYASNGHEIAVECGNFPTWKRPLYESRFGKNNTIHLPYPKLFGKYNQKDIESDSLNLQQQKQFLVDIYNKQIYASFKDDPVFDFQEFNEETRDIFDIDNHRTYNEVNPDWVPRGNLGEKTTVRGKNVWMNFPSSKTLSKEEYKKRIHWGALYYGSGVIAITVIFGGTEPCADFLRSSDSTHEKILIALNKLSDKWHIRDGFSFWDKSHMPPLDKEWNDPIPCNQLSKEEYDTILENLDTLIYMQKNGQKVGPVLDLAKGFFEEDEIPEAIGELRELYSVLLKSETKIDVVASKIKKILDWAWFVSQTKDWLFLRELYIKEFGEDVSESDFKKACRTLRYDVDYEKYMKGE